MTRRYVRENDQGTWDVLPEGHHRSLVQAQTRAKAVQLARAEVRRAGGGEVRVMDDVGKIAETVAVKPAASRRRRAVAA